MRIYANINKIKGNAVQLNLDDKINLAKLEKFSNGHQPIVELRIHDQRVITNKQRRKTFAMLRDITNYTGYESMFAVENWMKAYYMATYGLDYFSLSDTTESNATHFIDYLIRFCFQWSIPFKWKTYEQINQDYTFQRECVLNRKCLICGKRAQIDHIVPVGMGRNRQKIDNRQFVFTALCSVHHRERHSIGWPAFTQKYHIHVLPIKLTHDEIQKLNIGG